MALSLTHTNSAMHGNGLQEFGMLVRDYRSSYTLPEISKNQATTLSLNARYQATPKLQRMLIVNNLLAKRYVTSATLSPIAFNGSGSFMARPFAPVNGAYPLTAPTFVAPGAPRGVWLAARYSFGR